MGLTKIKSQPVIHFLKLRGPFIQGLFKRIENIVGSFFFLNMT
jgi:hypothetical protein